MNMTMGLISLNVSVTGCIFIFVKLPGLVYFARRFDTYTQEHVSEFA